MYQPGTGNGDNPLYQWLSIVALVPLMVLSISGCEASQKDVGGANAGQQFAADHAADKPATATNSGKNVANQPIPINQRFRSLDEYLAHLERTHGPIDKPWYKEVRPGVYELQTGNLRTLGSDDEKQRVTREEIKRKFGFSK
jgi:hypothetical protein